MQKIGAIQCSNPNCQAINDSNNQFCHQCHTPIIKRYLWTIGEAINQYHLGDLLQERYLLKQPQVVLDTKPGLAPQGVDELPYSLLPYLKLFSYRFHLPQIYGVIQQTGNPSSTIWLLEYLNVPIDHQGELKYPQLFPKLHEKWPQSNGLTQLNWLWQIVKLWQPLKNQGVAITLLDPALLRINGGLLQLLELRREKNIEVNYHQLGSLWLNLVDLAAPEIQDFLAQLCQKLEKKIINDLDSLQNTLEETLYRLGHAQKRTYQIFTTTDKGRIREQNEDACYPSPGTFIKTGTCKKTLTIVCDGLGGQEGGEIASKLAIDNLSQLVNNLDFDARQWNPAFNQQELYKTVGIVNNIISEQNDLENRQERQRMGTTIVMSLAYEHEIYLLHVGDSRIYRITEDSCHQVTVDDDLAAREVRLGTALHRDVLQHPAAGALIQALGMSSSYNLHPNIQRQIIDQDTVFLLCSDGLSDYDRVEQYWRSEIAPILQQKTDVKQVAQRLIEIANQKNGHDNVTVGLVYCQVHPQEQERENSYISLSTIESSLPTKSNPHLSKTVKLNGSESDKQPSDNHSHHPKKNSFILLTIALLSLLTYLFFNSSIIIEKWQKYLKNSTDTPHIEQPIPELESKPSTPVKSKPLIIGDIIKINNEIPLYPSPQYPKTNNEQIPKIPANSIVKIITEKKETQRPDFKWLEIKVCQTPSPGKIDTATKIVKQGWITASVIQGLVATEITDLSNSCPSTSQKPVSNSEKNSETTQNKPKLN